VEGDSRGDLACRDVASGVLSVAVGGEGRARERLEPPQTME
jgi:hypothetical protein